jgi:hypothetical protein
MREQGYKETSVGLIEDRGANGRLSFDAVSQIVATRRDAVFLSSHMLTVHSESCRT